MSLMMLAAFLAFFVKGICGFANTLVFSSILSFSISNVNISPIELLVGYPSNMIIAWTKRKETDYRIWLPLSIFVIIGMIPGTIFLVNGNIELVKVFFGIIIVFIGIEMLSRDLKMISSKTSKTTLVIVGVMAGFLCGVFGIGAMLAAYIGRTTKSSDAFKGNLCIVFFVENTFRIIMYSIAGIITGSVIIVALKLIPFMLLGLFLGMKSSNLLPEKWVRKMVVVLLILSGVALILLNM